VAFLLEQPAQHAAQIPLVIRDEDAGHVGGGAGC
jgi:hypothetical protein